MSSLQAISYLGAAVTAGGSAPALNPVYESTEALQSAVGQGRLMDFDSPGNTNRGVRAMLTAGINGDDDETAIEDLYLLMPLDLDGKPRVLVEPIGSITWTAGATSFPGGRTGEKVAKAGSLGGTGRLKTRTGIEIEIANAQPAIATIYDIGPGRWLFRVPRVGTATGVSLLGATWR